VLEQSSAFLRQRDSDGALTVSKQRANGLDELLLAKACKVTVPAIARTVLQVSRIDHTKRPSDRQGANLRLTKLVVTLTHPDVLTGLRTRDVQLLDKDVLQVEDGALAWPILGGTAASSREVPIAAVAAIARLLRRDVAIKSS